MTCPVPKVAPVPSFSPLGPVVRQFLGNTQTNELAHYFSTSMGTWYCLDHHKIRGIEGGFWHQGPSSCMPCFIHPLRVSHAVLTWSSLFCPSPHRVLFPWTRGSNEGGDHMRWSKPAQKATLSCLLSLLFLFCLRLFGDRCKSRGPPLAAGSLSMSRTKPSFSYTQHLARRFLIALAFSQSCHKFGPVLNLASYISLSSLCSHGIPRVRSTGSIALLPPRMAYPGKSAGPNYSAPNCPGDKAGYPS